MMANLPDDKSTVLGTEKLLPLNVGFFHSMIVRSMDSRARLPLLHT